MGIIHLIMGGAFILYGIHVLDKARAFTFEKGQDFLYQPHKIYGYVMVVGGILLFLGGIWETLI